MSNLILPQKWTNQPQTPVGIDWGNPLTRGLAFAWNAANPRHLENGRLATTDNTGKIIAGIGRAVDSSTGQVNLEWANYQPIVTSDGAGTGDFTLCLLANPAVAGGGAVEHGLAQKNDAAGAPYAQATLLFHANATAGYVSGSVSFFTYSSSSAGIAATGKIDGNWHLWTGTRRGTTFSLYRDAELIASATDVVRNISQASRYLAIGSRGNGTTEAYRDGAAFAFGSNRALSASEIATLASNPWQIFKAPARRLWVAGAGGNGTATITGVSGAGQVGALSPSGNASVSLPGASGAGSVGNVVASVSAATAITGVNGAGQVGNTTQTGAANVAVSTVAGTGQVGTVSASGIGAPDGNVAITGIAGTGQVGTLAASGNGAVSITGIAATGSVGSVTPSVTVTTTITGAIGTGSVGTTTQTGAANATVSSAVGIGLVGTVSATGTSQDGNAVISGISGIGSVGIVSANDGTVVNNHGFIIIDTEPRLWWKRKPRKLDDKEAEEKIVEVVRTIERVANSIKPSVSKEVLRKAAYAEIAPLLQEMPGFDWSPMFRAILTQSKLQEQNRIAAEQAGILAKQEIERIKRIRDDEDALIVLLMGA
jgi:hypothetical protein